MGCCGSLAEVDLQESLNCSRHHTDLFDEPGKFVIRRAASVSVQLPGMSSFSEAARSVSVVFALRGTIHSFKATEADSDGSGWCLKWGQDGQLDIAVPPQAPIGTYNVHVELGTGTKKVFPKDVVVLCNPWGEADDVYLADEEQRREYVVEDDGAIWVGSSDSNHPRPWGFGQYEEGVLAACLDLVELLASDRGDAVKLTRHLSAAVNHMDDGGVLIGNWSGEYDGGKSPTFWVGSAPILRQWRESGPVKFGQCWVFSGLLTTVCRCLGIPARSVTCFDSAHDTNFNRVIDKYYDANREKLNIGGDSIWNFHVWNDVWLRRPDLPEGRGGWQAVDATPQEKSAGKWQCGPASLADIKAGRAGSNYDLDFLVGEVNADVRYYTVGPDNKRSLFRVDSDHVGKYVITKAVGAYKAHDITSDYKHGERTIAERVALLAQAVDSTYKQPDKGTFKVARVGELMVGEDIGFKLKLQGGEPEKWNQKKEKWTCRLALRSTSYRGRELEVLAETTQVLTAGQEMTVSAKPADYMKYLTHQGFPVSAIVHCINERDDAMWLDELLSSMQTAELEITVPTKRPFEAPVVVWWKNPLAVPLTDCHLEVAVSGVVCHSKDIGELAAGAPLSERVPLEEPDAARHWANGHAQVVATLTSRELHDVMGRADMKME